MRYTLSCVFIFAAVACLGATAYRIWFSGLHFGASTQIAVVALGVLLAVLLTILATYIAFWVRCNLNEALVIVGSKRTRAIIEHGAVIFPGFQNYTRIRTTPETGQFEFFSDDDKHFSSKDMRDVKARGSYIYKIGDDKESLKLAAKSVRNLQEVTITEEFQMAERVEAALSKAISERNYISEIMPRKDELSESVRGALQDSLEKHGVRIESFTIQAVNDRFNTRLLQEQHDADKFEEDNKAELARVRDKHKFEQAERTIEQIEHQSEIQRKELGKDEEHAQFERQEAKLFAENQLLIKQKSIEEERLEHELSAAAREVEQRFEREQLTYRAELPEGDFGHKERLRQIEATERVAAAQAQVTSEALRHTNTTIIAGDPGNDALNKHIQGFSIAELINSLFGALNKNDDLVRTVQMAAAGASSFATSKRQQHNGADQAKKNWNDEDSDWPRERKA